MPMKVCHLQNKLMHLKANTFVVLMMIHALLAAGCVYDADWCDWSVRVCLFCHYLPAYFWPASWRTGKYWQWWWMRGTRLRSPSVKSAWVNESRRQTSDAMRGDADFVKSSAQTILLKECGLKSFRGGLWSLWSSPISHFFNKSTLWKRSINIALHKNS